MSIMTFKIYGRLRLQVERTGDRWAMYRLIDGRRQPYFRFAIPPDMEESEIATYLDDMLHESAGPNDIVQLLSRTD